jgi:MFS family permease
MSLVRLPAAFRILKNGNYRQYFMGQLISMSGTWMQSVALSWLVYRLSGSAYWLGVITMCGQFPAFLMGPFSGVVADRVDRRKILITVSLIECVQAILLAALVFSGAVQLWHIVAMAVLLGIVTSFEMTARHAFAIDIVGREDLVHGITLNSALINGARIIGPGIAGVMIKLVGESWCFLLNGLSYLPVVWWLWRMNVRSTLAHAHEDGWIGVWHEIADAWKYVLRHRVIFRILALSTFVCFVACPYMALMPVFAKKVLQGGPDTLAWLTGMVGVGALMGALIFSNTHASSDVIRVKQQLIKFTFFWGCALVLLGVSRSISLSFFASFGIGYFMMSTFLAMNSAIQYLVEDSKRGRVMSLYTMTFLGPTPLGSLLAGYLADRFSAPSVEVGAGFGVVVASLMLIGLFSLRSRRRRLGRNQASDQAASASYSACQSS